MEYFSPTQQNHLKLVLSKVATRRNQGRVYPPADRVLRALELTPLSTVKVVIVGQDPYHQPGQADGLAFSSERIPKSLRNVLQELTTDLGHGAPATGRLDRWATQGVLLLNRILTVDEGQPLSHKNVGWLPITDSVIQTISEAKPFVVFVLWGSFAQMVRPLIDARHRIIEAPHPSPLSVHRGFWGHKPFSRINEALESNGLAPIDFSLL